jgi:c-di-GMP-binding flagellar brake protein YcgR
MEFSNRVQGEKVVQVLGELQQQKTPMRIRVLGRGYDRLTIVTGFASRNGRNFLLVDLPGGFESNVGRPEGARVKLEFADKARIPHVFRTVIHHAEDQDLWLVLPEFLERTQRRRFFRVEPPQGTRILFPFEGRKIEVPVLDISLGGGLIISPGKDTSGTLPLRVGTSLSDLELRGKVDGKGVEIRIRKAEVKRVDTAPDSQRTHFAVQFLDLKREDELALDRFIYDSQRRLLKKRSLLLGE